MSNSGQPHRQQPTAGLGVILLWGWAPTVQYILPQQLLCLHCLHCPLTEDLLQVLWIFPIYDSTCAYPVSTHLPSRLSECDFTKHIDRNYLMKEQDLYPLCKKCFKTDKEEWTSWWSTPRKKAQVVSMSILQEDHFEEVACQLQYSSESPRLLQHWSLGQRKFLIQWVWGLPFCSSLSETFWNIHSYLKHFENVCHKISWNCGEERNGYFCTLSMEIFYFLFSFLVWVVFTLTVSSKWCLLLLPL